MKRRPALSIFPLLVIAACAAAAPKPKRGPIADWVYLNPRSGEVAALKETAEGKADLFAWEVPGGALGPLSAAVRAKLETYRVPSESWSLLFNPVPNAPPYTVTVRNKTYFNPFAIREVRFAMNLLIDRSYVAQKILGGYGSAMFTMAAPGRPGSSRYNLIAAELGLTPAGNEKKAVADVDAALSRASGLPELKGKLLKREGKWSFNGEPVTVKLIMRSDDPDGRLREGRYAADQIEKTGIRVERLEYDRLKATAAVYNADPSDYQWNAYTESWGAEESKRYWDTGLSQMYAPWNGNMPGGQAGEFWNYGNPEIDALAWKAANGLFIDEKEYWDDVLNAQEIGLREAVRIFVCSRDRILAARKSAFSGRFVNGTGGADAWPLVTADVKPQKNGQKILRAVGFLPKESPYMGAWDPVGIGGFPDQYSRLVALACSDGGSFIAPYTARDAPWRASWSDVQTGVKVDKDGEGRETLAGEIPVPEDAVLYDSAAQAWRKVGPGVHSFSRATYSYKWGKWHTGRPIGTADFMYAFAFAVDWMTRDGENDPRYDPAFESAMRPAYSIFRGITLNKDRTVTLYMDYYHFDPDRVAGQCALFVGAHGSNPIGVSWEIAEALSRMVAEGGKSGTAWSFSTGREVDLLDPACLKDLRAKLQEMKAASYVPPSIREWLTPAEAAASYDAALTWIAAHKNAYISNGPFFVNDVDPDRGFVELRANRDPSYPFEAGYWNKLLRTRTTRIDAVSPSAAAAEGKAARIGVKVSLVDYPSGAVKAATAAVKVKVTLVTPQGQKFYDGRFVSPGRFVAAIPAQDMALEEGVYPLAVETRLENEEPDVEASYLAVP
jgi:peptide/nickel transport system substrate-binding protein